MSCRLIGLGFSLLTSTSRLSFQLRFQHVLRGPRAHPSSILCRNFRTSETNFKRRKTREEKKAPVIIEYSPKKHSDSSSLIIDVWRNMTVKELSENMKKDMEDVQEAILYTMKDADIHPRTKLDDINIIKEIVKKFGMRIKIVAHPSTNCEKIEKDRDVHRREPAKPEDLKPRAPVVTVMGHVDHGKTTLLDSLRGAAVAQNEAGGITQHIGAFTVALHNGEKVTFLDTPGHAAFSAMRARGSKITDIIVLVVAADDGVLQTTKEVTQLAKNENVPIIVAINKIDKPEANIEGVKRGLAQIGINLEGYGGETQYVCISAKEGTNLEELTEAISTQATLMGLKSEFKGAVEGIVVESSTDKLRGKLSTAIVTRGTLRKGAILVSGLAWAKVRALFDHAGFPIDSAVPGTPVEILGWRELPESGEEIIEVESEKVAQSVMRWREQQAQQQKAESDLDFIKLKQAEHNEKYLAEREERRKKGKYKRKATGPRSKEFIEDNSVPRVNVIIKGDVHGSVETILDVLETYHENDQVRLDIVHYGVGDVTESDIELAKTFKAIIYAFSVKAPKIPLPKNVKIVPVNIIYRLVDNLKEEISAKIPPLDIPETIGEANVLQIFEVNEGRKKVTVLGCRCVKGVLKKNLKYKLLRNDEVLYDGKLDSMRHLKLEVDSIKKDLECGLRLENFEVEAQPGDVVVCYTINKKSQETPWDPGF